MRLWHESLISSLPRQQLLGQHRECCALRGRGWGRPHSVVNYVFDHSPEHLIAYHFKVMNEMKARGYHPDETWYNGNWRGTTLGEHSDWCNFDTCLKIFSQQELIYPEHDDAYLQECRDNLKSKGIDI